MHDAAVTPTDEDETVSACGAGALTEEESGDTCEIGNCDASSGASLGSENVTAVSRRSTNRPPRFPQKRAGALLLMAELALAKSKAGVQPASTAERFQVIVHLHANAASMASSCTVEHDGQHMPLSHATMHRLACDASLRSVACGIGTSVRGDVSPHSRLEVHLDR